MRIFDVTVPTRPRMPVCPGDPQVHLTRALAIADGDARTSAEPTARPPERSSSNDDRPG
jgi:kynurenine formamidase